MGVARKYDIVVFGATGFTGKLVCDYLNALPLKTVRWAIAGRNKSKLEALGFNVDIIVADIENASSFCALTTCVISTVGPFLKYGENVVKECIRSKTHYIDSTGETVFVKKMIEKYGDSARDSGIKLVSCCGVDSIPADLGTFFTVEQMRTAFGKNVNVTNVDLYCSGSGGVSGGTIASMMNMFEDWNSVKESNAQYYLNEQNEGPPISDVYSIGRFDSRWIGPHVMALVDTRVVRRSESLFHALNGVPYSKSNQFHFREFSIMSSLFKMIMMLAGIFFIVLTCMFRPTRNLMKRILPAPGSGPSEEERAKGFFKFLFVAKGSVDGKEVSLETTVSGGDPGSTETAKMLAESGLCVCFDDLPFKQGGFLTPAVAFGSKLIKRLNAQGIKFSLK